MNILYQEIETELNAHLPLDWSLELRGRLFTLVAGVILAQSIGPRAMATALHQHGISQASVESNERQIRRIENDTRLTAAACVHPFARHHLLFGKPTALTLIIDPTTHTDKIVLLMVSVRYRGRALPLAWMLWAANTPLKGAGFWERVAQLLALVADLLPVRIPVIWLADRAFGTPQFTDLVQAYGWHFVVRVQGQTRFADRIGHQRRIDALMGRHRRFKGHGRVFKSSGWRDLNVVVYGSCRHKGPLCLVSDLDAEWSLISLYRLRYNIEAMFRDYKAQGWRWEQAQVYDLEHTERLLIGMALAMWLTLMAGTQVADEWLARPPTGQRHTPPKVSQSSLFQLGLQRLKQWAVANTRLPLRFWLASWSAPNWQDQITQHHLHAFVMGTIASVVKLRDNLYSIVRP